MAEGGDESMASNPKAPLKSASTLELDLKEDRLMDAGWLMLGWFRNLQMYFLDIAK